MSRANHMSVLPHVTAASRVHHYGYSGVPSADDDCVDSEKSDELCSKSMDHAGCLEDGAEVAVLTWLIPSNAVRRGYLYAPGFVNACFLFTFPLSFFVIARCQFHKFYDEIWSRSMAGDEVRKGEEFRGASTYECCCGSSYCSLM